MGNPKLSIIITVYNSANSIRELTERIEKSMSIVSMSYEIIFVEDRSKDNSWSMIKELMTENPNFKGIRFIRNFGQHAALTAGLQHSSGEFTIMMDGDLQDQPEIIPSLYNKIVKSKKSIVFVRRMNRKDSLAKRKSSLLFNYFFSLFSGMNSDPSIGTYRIMDAKVINAFRKFTEVNKYIGGLFYWMNFDHDFLDAEHSERRFGKSNYNLKRLIQLSTRGIVSFSNKPLIFSIYLGITCSFFSFIMAIYFLLRKFVLNISVTGYSSIIVSIFFIGGCILLVLGIIGRYIAEIHDQVRSRPEYLIDEIINFDV